MWSERWTATEERMVVERRFESSTPMRIAQDAPEIRRSDAMRTTTRRQE